LDFKDIHRSERRQSRRIKLTVMEITKKEVEELIGDEVLTYKVTKSYRGYKVIKVKVVAIKAKDSKEVTITLKPNK
jgi:hypothetical protein